MYLQAKCQRPKCVEVLDLLKHVRLGQETTERLELINMDKCRRVIDSN